ncbi:hypothetical protein JW935_19935 [candidate division KSB1 bacterium]|nr:hypothetical protein [candidate division KSB1 bacterium]
MDDAVRGKLESIQYRRQFILGPRFLLQFPHWQKVKVGKRFCLHVHPDLQLVQVRRGRVCLTLLGFILDPDDPGLDNAGILEKILDRIKKADQIFQCTRSLGGRWILVIDDGSDIFIYNDCMGFRQLVYTDTAFPENWCASESGLPAEILGLNFDSNVVTGFLESDYYKNEKGYQWPGDSTPYKEIRHLLPNHYFDLKKRHAVRFWPNKMKENMSLEDGARASSVILTNLIKAASQRFRLAFAVTSGYDSRMTLAAARNELENGVFYTLVYGTLNEKSPDVKIPARMLKRLNLQHRIIFCPSRMDEDFARIYKKNVVTAHEFWGAIAQGLSGSFPDDRIAVKTYSEITRCYLYPYDRPSYYYPFKIPQKITAETLAMLYKMKGNTFAESSFQRWLDGFGDLEDKYNYKLLDVFYWEQRMGKWQAMSQLEWDLVQEVFNPFNCRMLTEILLAVDLKHRRPPHYTLFRKIIELLWPELLEEPIDPPTTGLVIKKILKMPLIRTNTLHFFMPCIQSMRKRLSKK